MKRKYLSALLMGVLTLSSVSTFTSCKDYDDDISNLQEQIDKLATADQLSQKVAELQALISSNTSSIGTLQSALDEAKKAAEKAQTTADSKATLDQVNGILADYAKVSYVDDAKKSLNDAIEALKTGDITTLKADVEAAAKAAAAAKADAEAAIAEVKKDLENNYVTNATYKSEKEAAEAALETLKNQVAANTGNIQANADAIVKLQAVDVVTKADLVAKLGEYATAQQAKALQQELTDLKKNFAEEIAKYAKKSDLNSLATKEELQKASEKAANDLQTKLNDYLKAEVLAKLATKDDIKDLQNKEAVQNLIKDAIQALKDGDIKSIGDKADEALQKANKAESTEGLAYVKALAAEGKAVAAATAAATADSKAEANKSEIATIKNILGDKFDAKNTVSAAIELINSQLTNDKTGLAALDGRLSSIESLLNQDTPDATSLKTRVDNIENKLKDIIGQYSTMVTDVQLYNFASPNNTGFNQELNFIQATEQANVFPGAGVADAQFTFEKGKYFVGEDSLLIRVSPVDAELTTSNISLLNSQGKELNDLIEVTDAHRYSELLYGQTVPTRAGVDANTGLWVVKFKAKDLGDAFKAAAETKVGNDNKYVLYSVAVKNTYTTDEAKDRRVTSEYCVNLSSAEAEHAYDFTVNKTSIKNIFNRYKECPRVEELVWKNKAKPATTVVKDNPVADKNNAVNRPATNNDDRSDQNILAVEKGGDIVIDFTKQIGLSGTDQNKDFGVKGFYVTLDEKFAHESGVSEINAWRSYSYVNVGYKKSDDTVVPAKLFTGNKGIIKINDMGNVKGDVIGFRVYAVNYDGTLTDPDGRAFYVAVGDVQGVKNLGNSELTLNGTAAGSKFESTVALSADLSNLDFDGFTGWKITAADASGTTPTLYNAATGAGDFKVEYYDKDGKKLNITEPNSKVKSIKFILEKPQSFIDGATYNVTGTLTKKISTATSNVCVLNASFTKKMPESAPTFSYRDGFKSNPEYIVPLNNRAVMDYAILYDNNGKMVNKSGYFDLRNILIINNNQSWNGVDLFEEANTGMFQFNIANGQYGTDGNLATASASGPNYVMYVDNRGKNLVDNTTEHTIAAVYNYKNISKKYDETSKSYKKFIDYPVDSKSTEKIVYCSWMKTFGYDVKSNIVVVEEPQEVKVWNDELGKYETKKKLVKVSKELNTWLNNNTVDWKSDGKGGKTLNFSNLAVSVADYNLLPVTKGLTGKSIDKFFESEVIAIVGNVYTTSNDGKQKNPYFSATVAEDGSGITLTQISQQAIPSSVTGGKIHFTIIDCFGNTKAVELPFKINVKAVTAKKH